MNLKEFKKAVKKMPILATVYQAYGENKKSRQWLDELSYKHLKHLRFLVHSTVSGQDEMKDLSSSQQDDLIISIIFLAGMDRGKKLDDGSTEVHLPNEEINECINRLSFEVTLEHFKRSNIIIEEKREVASSIFEKIEKGFNVVPNHEILLFYKKFDNNVEFPLEKKLFRYLMKEVFDRTKERCFASLSKTKKYSEKAAQEELLNQTQNMTFDRMIELIDLFGPPIPAE